MVVILTESTFHSTDTGRSTGKSFSLLGTFWRIRSDVRYVTIKGGKRKDEIFWLVLLFNNEGDDEANSMRRRGWQDGGDWVSQWRQCEAGCGTVPSCESFTEGSSLLIKGIIAILNLAMAWHFTKQGWYSKAQRFLMAWWLSPLYDILCFCRIYSTKVVTSQSLVYSDLFSLWPLNTWRQNNVDF